MPRQRRKNKVLASEGSVSSSTQTGCPNCQKQQRKIFYKNREFFTGLPEKATLYEYLKQPIMDIEQKKPSVSDSESEVDSAIETASVSSETLSLSSDPSYSDDLSLTGPNCREKTAVVSINSAFTNYENQANMSALADYYTGVPLQKFTRHDECYTCEYEIHAYNEYMHQCYVDQLVENNMLVVDISGLDIGVHIEEYSEMSLVNGDFQSKIHNYYVSSQGATYYTDIPLKETRELKVLKPEQSLPKQFMIPPSERSVCKLWDLFYYCSLLSIHH